MHLLVPLWATEGCPPEEEATLQVQLADANQKENITAELLG